MQTATPHSNRHDTHAAHAHSSANENASQQRPTRQHPLRRCFFLPRNLHTQTHTHDHTQTHTIYGICKAHKSREYSAVGYAGRPAVAVAAGQRWRGIGLPQRSAAWQQTRRRMPTAQRRERQLTRGALTTHTIAPPSAQMLLRKRRGRHCIAIIVPFNNRIIQPKHRGVQCAARRRAALRWQRAWRLAPRTRPCIGDNALWPPHAINHDANWRQTCRHCNESPQITSNCARFKTTRGGTAASHERAPHSRAAAVRCARCNAATTTTTTTQPPARTAKCRRHQTLPLKTPATRHQIHMQRSHM